MLDKNDATINIFIPQAPHVQDVAIMQFIDREILTDYI